MAGVTFAFAGPRVIGQYLQNSRSPGSPTSLGFFGVRHLSFRVPIAYPPNVSFLGFFSRALSRNPYGPSIANDLDAMQLLSALAAGVVLLTVAVLTWPRQRSHTLVSEMALVLAAIPLVEPFGEYHHATLVIVPFLLSFYAVDSLTGKIVLVAALVLLDVHGLFWHHLVGMTFLLSLGTYGLLLIFLITALSLRERRKVACCAAGSGMTPGPTTIRGQAAQSTASEK